MKLSQYAKQHEIGYRAAWERYRKGRIPGAYMDENGRIVVPHPNEVRAPMAAVYARVSSAKQKDDLERQAQRMTTFAIARGYTVVSVVKEVASGVNDTRPRLTKLLQDEEWGTLVIEHKDRLSRVGFHWFELLLGAQGRRIAVANAAEEERADLLEDLASIIYSFCARMYGLRRAQNRAAAVKRLLKEPDA